MTWGGLNPALTAWRNAIERRFGQVRGRESDGARADGAHGSASQHQEDSDGTVDAFDMDVNVLGSASGTGSPAERRLIAAMKLDFERDPRARSRLWIHDRVIANREVGNFRERDYEGRSPHDKHVHWESRQDHEDVGSDWPMPNTDALLRAMRGDDDMPSADEIATAVVTKLLNEDLGREGGGDTVGVALQTGALGNTGKILERVAAVEKAVAEIRAAVVPAAAAKSASPGKTSGR